MRHGNDVIRIIIFVLNSRQLCAREWRNYIHACMWCRHANAIHWQKSLSVSSKSDRKWMAGNWLRFWCLLINFHQNNRSKCIERLCGGGRTSRCEQFVSHTISFIDFLRKAAAGATHKPWHCARNLNSPQCTVTAHNSFRNFSPNMAHSKCAQCHFVFSSVCEILCKTVEPDMNCVNTEYLTHYCYHYATSFYWSRNSHKICWIRVRVCAVHVVPTACTNKIKWIPATQRWRARVPSQSWLHAWCRQWQWGTHHRSHRRWPRWPRTFFAFVQSSEHWTSLFDFIYYPMVRTFHLCRLSFAVFGDERHDLYMCPTPSIPFTERTRTFSCVAIWKADALPRSLSHPSECCLFECATRALVTMKLPRPLQSPINAKIICRWPQM